MNSHEKKHRTAMLSVFLFSLLALFLFVPPIHQQVKAKCVEWDIHGFFGFPIKTTGTDSTGRSSQIILTSSKIEPIPESTAQWSYAAKQVLNRWLEDFFA